MITLLSLPVYGKDPWTICEGQTKSLPSSGLNLKTSNPKLSEPMPECNLATFGGCK